MKFKQLLIIFFLIFFSIYFFLFFKKEGDILLFLKDNQNKFLNKNSYIAHSSGSVDGIKYTNSHQGLRSSINLGYRLIELDLQVTEDNKIVAVHDWLSFKKNCKNLNLKIDSHPLSYKEFNECEHYVNQRLLRQLNEDDINKFFLDNKSLILVTDKIKNYNILKKNLKFQERIIPETFGIWSYIDAKINGFRDVIFPYKKANSFLNFIFNINVASLNSNDFIKRKNKINKDFKNGMIIIIYTSNDHEFNKKNIGVNISGVYTDFWNINESKCYLLNQIKCTIY